MTRKILALLIIVGASTPATAQVMKAPLQLKPASSWHVDYADQRCRLMREFGQGEQQVYAIFDRYEPGEHFRFTLAGKPMKTSLHRGDLAIQFGPNEGEQRLEFSTGNIGELPALLINQKMRVAPPTPAEQSLIEKADPHEWIDLQPVGSVRETAIKTLTISKPLRRSVVLETGSMRKPLVAFEKCIDNLLTTWGIDVARHKTLTRTVKPLTSPGKWVVSQDYPVKMLDAGQSAIVEFRLSVGADGAATSCHIQSTTRPKEFDAAVCDSLMKRARFSPAIDSEGKPLASYYQGTVRFALP